MKIDVQGHELRGTIISSGSAVRGAKLIGSELTITDKDDKRYKLRIEGIEEKPFWAQCTSNCDGAPATVPLYQFKVTSDADGCLLELCKPGLDADYKFLQGTAVIFRGDLYDDTFRVRASPTDPLDGDRDTFNIACVGTAISKLHLLRHTAASAGRSDPPTINQREAMLRLLAADYCGIGHSFTNDGLPIRLGFWKQGGLVEDYSMTGAQSIDALWTDQGASCIGVPRWMPGGSYPSVEELRAEIKRTCNREIPDCGSLATPLGPLAPRDPRDPPDPYAISGNPKPL